MILTVVIDHDKILVLFMYSNFDQKFMVKILLHKIINSNSHLH